MIKIKKLLFAFCLCFALCLASTALFSASTNSARAETITNSHQLTESILTNYVTISSFGKILTIDNFKTIEGSSYIYSKENISVNINNPFSNSFYSFTLSDTDCFYLYYTEIELSYQNEGAQIPATATINGTTYEFEYVINLSSNQVTIILNNTNIIVNGSSSDFLKFDYENHKLLCLTSITWKAESNDSSMSFTVMTYGKYGQEYNEYIICFCKPISILDGDDFIKYNCFGFDAGDSESGYTYSILPTEKIYNKVEVEFFKNYTITNPLYFDVDYNGFVFNFVLYTENSKLVVNYLTNYNNTKQDADIENIATEYEDIDGILSTTNTYKLVFQKLGRYEITFYDSSYLLSTDPLMSNCLKTSFYIIENTDYAYKNIFCLFQSYSNETDHQYIVSVSTSSTNYPILNTNVELIVRNLDKLSDAEKDKFELQITKTEYTGTEQNNEEFLYTAQMLLNDYNCELFYENDSYYEVVLKYDGVVFKTYKFEIIKKVKASFSANATFYESKEDFVKKSATFSNSLPSTFLFKSQLGASAIFNHTISQDYENTYTVYYGKPYVELGVNKGESSMILTFKGIGTITAKITFNGVTTTYTMPDDVEGSKILTFNEFGTYKIQFSDEMNTTKIQTIKFSKPLNTSTILLVGISGLILAMILVFVLISRKKVATR